MQVFPQALLQQTPSAQWPLAQSIAHAQAAPLAFGATPLAHVGGVVAASGWCLIVPLLHATSASSAASASLR
jgi:hypothetical protein